MNNQLLFDFIVDKTAKTVTVNKEFNAELSLVWDAFTKQEILDQWWAPKPWESRTKFMNFEVGGKDFMQWLVQKDKNIGRYNSILPLVQNQFQNAQCFCRCKRKSSFAWFKLGSQL
jgi:hypothetical protein